MRLIPHTALAFAAVALTAAIADAADKPTLVSFTEAPGADRVMLIDERPAEDKTESLGPLLITKCTYGVYRVADDATEPSRLTLLRSDLAAALGAQLDGHTITVRHYGLYLNRANEVRNVATAVAAGAGAIAAGAPNQAITSTQIPIRRGSDCPPEKMQGGWYGDGEATTDGSPFIAELTVEVDGREYSVRAVVSSPKRTGKPPRAIIKDPVFSPLLFEAMRGANAALVKSLQSAH